MLLQKSGEGRTAEATLRSFKGRWHEEGRTEVFGHGNLPESFWPGVRKLEMVTQKGLCLGFSEPDVGSLQIHSVPYGLPPPSPVVPQPLELNGWDG